MDVFTQLVVDADCERVWRAWEEPKQLRGWWSPGGSVVTSASVELTPGGPFMVSSEGRGLVFEVSGTVEAASRPRSFVTTWIWTQGDRDIAGQETRLVVHLDPEDTGTRVTVQQSGFSTEEARRSNAEGWDRVPGHWSKYEHPFHVSPTPNQHDAIDACPIDEATGEIKTVLTIVTDNGPHPGKATSLDSVRPINNTRHTDNNPGISPKPSFRTR